MPRQRFTNHADTYESPSLTPNATGLKFWSDDAFRPHPTHSFAWYAGIYALLQVCALISLLLLAIAVLVQFVKKAGASLHWEILKTLLHAPLSFFVATDTGVVTNLFSQDLNLVDTELPNAFLNTLHCVSSFRRFVNTPSAEAFAVSFATRPSDCAKCRCHKPQVKQP